MDFTEIKTAVTELAETTKDRLDGLEGTLSEVKNIAETTATALRRTAGGSIVPQAEPVESKAFRTFLQRGVEAVPDAEKKALSVGSDPDGGYLVPTTMANEIIKNLVQFSPIRSIARVDNMTAGEVQLPKRTSNLTASWTGETSDKPVTQETFGQVRIVAHECSAIVEVSNKLLEDAAFNVEASIAMDFAEEFGRLEGVAFVAGDGVNKPFGFLTDSNIATVNSGNANLLTADGLINLFYDLPAFYRANASWVASSSTLAAIRKLKDSQGQYLWQPALAVGQPETVLGRPIVEAVDMPQVAAGAFPIAFGDFRSGYRIMDRVGVTVLRDPYTLAGKGIVRFVGRRRVGGAVVHAEAIRKQVVAA